MNCNFLDNWQCKKYSITTKQWQTFTHLACANGAVTTINYGCKFQKYKRGLDIVRFEIDSDHEVSRHHIYRNCICGARKLTATISVYICYTLHFTLSEIISPPWRYCFQRKFHRNFLQMTTVGGKFQNTFKYGNSSILFV